MTRHDSRSILLCFSHLRWGFVWQRPQHLLSRAARDYRVLFFEEAYIGPEIEAPFLYRAPPSEGVEVIVPHLPAGGDARENDAAVQRLLDACLGELEEAPAILWYYTPEAIAFTRHLDADVIVYDCMDELSAFRDAPPRLGELEQELLQRADLVTCGGRTLFEEKRRHHPGAHLFPSSIDAPHFNRARALSAQRSLHAQPVLGYFGVIDERLDLELVAALADLRPQWTIEMVGPVVKIPETALPLRPNIVWSGHVAYADLPERLARWDIGLMPFAMNEATRCISPTKTPEFLAAGVPVISTPVRDVVTPYGDAALVAIASDAEAFAEAAARLLRTPKGPWLATVDAFLATTSWDMTYENLRKLMRSNSGIARLPDENAAMADA
ncbi:MAG: glycosyl transferase [Hyphomicrobiales bacterium]|nr:glycosyl transferase [Hyphomicrobiales bacterium]